MLAGIAGWRPATPHPSSLRRLSTSELGALGEELAARFLRSLGLALIGRNLEAAEAELDIVAIDGDTLVVIEVKAGWWPEEPPNSRWGHRRPGTRITRTGVARRLRAARRLAKSAGLAQGRVDAIEVIAGRGPGVQILHHPRVGPDARIGR